MTTVGAVGPHSLRLSGEIADATLITCGTTPEALRQARQRIDAGRLAAGRSGTRTIIVNVLAATGAHAAERLEAEQRAWDFDRPTSPTPRDSCGSPRPRSSRSCADEPRRRGCHGLSTRPHAEHRLTS